jgi:hypothetical protein
MYDDPIGLDEHLTDRSPSHPATIEDYKSTTPALPDI